MSDIWGKGEMETFTTCIFLTFSLIAVQTWLHSDFLLPHSPGSQIVIGSAHSDSIYGSASPLICLWWDEMKPLFPPLGMPRAWVHCQGGGVWYNPYFVTFQHMTVTHRNARIMIVSSEGRYIHSWSCTAWPSPSGALSTYDSLLYVTYYNVIRRDQDLTYFNTSEDKMVRIWCQDPTKIQWFCKVAPLKLLQVVALCPKSQAGTQRSSTTF